MASCKTFVFEIGFPVCDAVELAIQDSLKSIKKVLNKPLEGLSKAFSTSHEKVFNGPSKIILIVFTCLENI